MVERSLHKAMVVGPNPTPGTVLLMTNQPIGIIDSGVGGLSVWREIVKQLPYESTIYLADSRNCPYGDKTPADIYSLARRLVQFLLTRQVKIIVIACNTITVTCLDKLRHDFPIVPIVGTVPVVKAAAQLSHNRRIGILSTKQTAQSVYQQELISRFVNDCQVINIGTDQLVPLVEAGDLTGDHVQAVVRQVLAPFQQADIDTLALGCTHFPFLKQTMQSVLGDQVRIMDSASAIARQVKRILESKHVQAIAGNASHQIFTTGNKKVLAEMLTKMGKHQIVQLINPM